MPGEDLQSWSTTAASNSNSDTSINWAEGQARDSVNNSARAMMAAHAKDRNLHNGSIVTAGTANAQTFLSGLNYTTTPTGLRVTLKIGPTLTNTAAATLDMDGLGANTIKDMVGADLVAGSLVADTYAEFIYNGTNWIWLFNTEFVGTAINTAIAGRVPLSAFRASMSADQASWPANTIIPISFNTAVFNLGSHFSAQKWTPPAGYVHISANVYAYAATAGAQYYLYLYKNGAPLVVSAMSLGDVAASAPHVSIVDQANGTDYYEMRGSFTAIGGGGGTVFSGAYSWFSGIVI